MVKDSTHSAETRAKIKESARKRWQDPVYRASVSNRQYYQDPEYRSKQSRAQTAHGHASNTARGKPSPTYRSWQAMMNRCTNQNSIDWPTYGGRGIVVCNHWLLFEHFLEDMGERPTGTSLDRWPRNDGNYEPMNCRWATPKEQAINRRKRVHAAVLENRQS